VARGAGNENAREVRARREQRPVPHGGAQGIDGVVVKALPGETGMRWWLPCSPRLSLWRLADSHRLRAGKGPSRFAIK